MRRSSSSDCMLVVGRATAAAVPLSLEARLLLARIPKIVAVRTTAIVAATTKMSATVLEEVAMRLKLPEFSVMFPAHAGAAVRANVTSERDAITRAVILR